MNQIFSLSAMRVSPGGQVAYSVFAGTGGTLLITLFLLGMMPMRATLTYLPWVLAFNGLTTGYTLMERTRERLRRRRTAAAGGGLLVGLTACGLLNLLSCYAVGAPAIHGPELLFFAGVSTAGGGLGAILAIQYFRLGKDRS